MRATRIRCTLDFERSGRQLGRLELSHSDNRHAYGVIPAPIALLAGAAGPTVLLTAGNHGDEYEGQIILQRLLRELDPGCLHGRLIVLPALNYPAVLAGARVSPLDGGNMNRAFPGNPDGPPTAALADFVESVLLPLCDAALDLHSGGQASQFLPCAFLCKGGGAELMQRKLAACRAFAAPVTAVVDATADGRSLSAAADRHGVVMLATELGGAGTISRRALRVGQEGLYRLLHQLGVLAPAPGTAIAPATRYLMTPDRSHYVMAPCAGIFEPAVSLGEAVEAGQLAGWVHALDDPTREPVEVRFTGAGVVICRRVPAPVAYGDYVFHTGVEVSEPALLEIA